MGSVQRFYVPGVALTATGQEVTLPAPVARQVTTVLRLAAGDPLVLFDGGGGEWQAVLLRTSRDSVTAKLEAFSEPGREPNIDVTLAQALLKADKFEWVLQKGTELGVNRFVPLISERVMTAGRNGALSEGKRERWQRIVAEAAEQSGRTRVPEITLPLPLIEAVTLTGQPLLCWEDERRVPFVRVLSERLADGARRCTILIGPEGGFSVAEVREAARTGATVCSLGERTLRSETAAVAALSLALVGGEQWLAPGQPGKDAAALPLAGRNR